MHSVITNFVTKFTTPLYLSCLRRDVRHGRNVHPIIWLQPHLGSLVDDSKDISEKSSSVVGCGQEQEETIYNQDETGAEVDSIIYFITEA